MTKLNSEKLSKVAGGTNEIPKAVAGMPNPICGVSFEDAMKKAEELGPDRKDMGGWTRMNNVDYLTWWADHNPAEYEKHKSEVDAIKNPQK